MKPLVDIVVGGQYGSEAKGKVCAYLAKKHRYGAAVRGGAENAGHTVIEGGRTFKMQVIPCAWVDPRTWLYVGAGTVFSTEQLGKEIEMLANLTRPEVYDRLRVDPGAMLIQEEHRQQERDANLEGRIGSTVHGCGAALAAKIWRNGAKLVMHDPGFADLRPENGVTDGGNLSYVSGFRRISERIAAHVQMNEAVMLEGTQGTLLSLDHAPHYPFCTSRNVTASGVAAECGVPPGLVREVILVFRTFPIRVGGNSGPTGAEELTWKDVSERAGRDVEEFTTVTHKRRRIFEFDWEEARYSVMLNRPTQIALTFADYFGAENQGVTEWRGLNHEARDFVKRMERFLGVPVTLISTGPETEATIDRTMRRFW